MKVTAAITAQNTWTDALAGRPLTDQNVSADRFKGITLSISGTFVATVTLQIAFDGGATWIDTGETWDAPATKIIPCYEPGVSFRAGVKTGGFVSGTVNLRLSK